MKLKDIGEFGLIERISGKKPKSSSRVIVGIGDDAAVVKISGEDLLVYTTDTMVESVHFDLSYCSYFSVGWKAMASNISDCIAMGGAPREALITIGLPDGTEVKDIDELYRGVYGLSREHGIDIVGGDTVSSPHDLFVSVCLIGRVKREGLVKRSGAKAGELILTTGYLGDAEAGRKSFKQKIKTSKLRAKHLMPCPRVRESRLIASAGPATSMIDNSDGLTRCLIEIARMSGVGARIKAAAIPISTEARAFCKKARLDPVELALGGGEDYELVFTAARSRADKMIKAVQARTGTKVSVLGEIVHKRNGIKLVDLDGRERELRSFGYDHFRRT